MFIRHVKYVQNILTTFKYVKIAWIFMCNLRFLILCFTDKDGSKGIIVEKCSTEEDESE